MKDSFRQAIEKRRSIYNLGRREEMSKQKMVDIIENAVKYAPSAFNSQSARVVILFEKNHDRLWDIVLECLRKIVPAKDFPKTEERIASFKKALGTVLFFEDIETIENLQARFPLYKDNFPKWSEQASGMAQFAVWTALADEGIGASLQHYNPLIDEQVVKEWKLSQNWRLMSEMPIGSIEAPADEKTFMPIEERVKIF